MGHIDGFLLALNSDQHGSYKAYAEKAVPIFHSQGATGVVERWGDDVPDGNVPSFPMAVKEGADETVVFGWISWPPKAVRDAYLQALREMSFDGMHLMLAGFEVIPDV